VHDIGVGTCKTDESKLLVGDITIFEVDEEHIE
jgi:hypothetical protein